LDSNRFRTGLTEPGEHLVGFLLHRHPGLLGQFRVIGEAGDAAKVATDGLVHGQYGKRRVTKRCFLHGPFQGSLRMTGTVNSDNDSRHFNPPLLIAAPTPLLTTVSPRDPAHQSCPDWLPRDLGP